jgi:hypothetical protein
MDPAKLVFGMNEIVLSNNLLTGQLPSEIGGLNASLAKLEVNDNQLSGGLPNEISSLSILQSFTIQNNPLLTGVIPDSFCAIGNLIFSCSDDLCGCDCRQGVCANATEPPSTTLEPASPGFGVGFGNPGFGGR